MKKIIYYVACSIDGYIAGRNDDVSKFIYQGDATQKYLEDLRSFETVMMGRNTYEFGYQFGAEPGQPSPAYPHMQHYIFSNNLKFEEKSNQVEIRPLDTEEVKRIKEGSRTDIYLCGGGQFAGWLLAHGFIDQLKIKLNPITLGGGTPLFGQSASPATWKLLHSESFDNGIQFITYERLA